MAKRGPSTKYDTFWVRIWQKSELSSKEIGDKLHVTGAAVRNWFSGRYMPDDFSISNLCELFNIDYATGKSEFLDAHEAYWANRDTKTTKVPTVVITEDDDKSEELPEEVHKTFDEVLRLLYKKVDYATFMRVYEVLKG